MLLSLALSLLVAEARADGAATYASLCSSCHGATGAGDGVAGAGLPVKPSNFTDPAFWNATRTDDYLKTVTTRGGAAVGKSPLMAPMGAGLSEAQLNELIVYLKTLKK